MFESTSASCCSRTSSSTAFLAAATPEVAIYMAGVDNTYGHPRLEIITVLEAVGAEIYGTDTHGTIVVTVSGEERVYGFVRYLRPAGKP